MFYESALKMSFNLYPGFVCATANFTILCTTQAWLVDCNGVNEAISGLKTLCVYIYKYALQIIAKYNDGRAFTITIRCPF